MGSKLLVLFALASVVVSSTANAVSQAEKWYAKGTPGFDYDCSGKVDGNYPHPTKCTHYVACVAQTEAYEMVCAESHDGKPLHYVQNSGPNEAESRCDYPEVAGCQGPTPTDAPPAQTTQTAGSDDDCNPDDCRLKGDCRDYYVCNRETSKWEKQQCGTDLFWNEAANNGSIHGGNCDFFLNLDGATQDRYRGDENCIEPCAFLQTDAQQCTGQYTYRERFDNRTLLNREHSLECPSLDGVSLVWDQYTNTCERCSEAKDASGNACSC